MARLGLGRNPIKQPIEISDVRVLSRADLTVLALPRPANSIQTLRDTHHQLARAIAAGLTNIEAAETCGYSYTRVSIMLNDPSFKDLVAHYRGLITAEFVREADPVIGFLRNNALKAQAMISDKLDAAAEKEEFLPTRDLLGIAELGLDRTGYGKVNKNVNMNVDFAKALEDARARSDKAREGLRTIEAQPVAQSPRPQSAPVVPNLPRLREPSPSTQRILRRV